MSYLPPFLQIFHPALILVLLTLGSCSSKQPNLSGEKETPTFQKTDTTRVNAMVLDLQDFYKETLSQGQVLAKEKVDVTLPVGEIIQSISINRGQRVLKGQILAILETGKWQQEYELLLAEMDEKKLQLEAKLISLGYDDLNPPPQSLLEKVEIELGIPSLKKRIEHKKISLLEKNITAPIDGMVAELEALEGNPTANYKKLCTILNDKKLEVKFPVLESEISSIKKGMSVIVSPFYGHRSMQAKITSYHPMVDENGLIWVYADLLQSQNDLLDGMKVKIIIREIIPAQRTVPKSAILDRQDRYVIFTYKNGTANWVYGHIDNENTTHYSLKDDGPQPGDTVIISNNFNLAHMEPVILDSVLSSP